MAPIIVEKKQMMTSATQYHHIDETHGSTTNRQP